MLAMESLFQSGSFLLNYMASHWSGESLRSICLYIMSPPMVPMDCQIISVGVHLYFANQVQL